MKPVLLAASIAAALVAAPARAAFDAAAAWRAFLGGASYSDTNAAYGALTQVGYVVDSVDAAACREHAGALESAARTVPVGLALRHAQLLCAEASADAAAADRASDAIAALVRHAAAAATDSPWRAPMRVVRPEDVDAFLQLGGLERRYAYYDQVWPAGGLPLTVAAAGDDGIERHLRFDWVDTLARLSSQDRFQGLLMDRHVIANDFLEGWARDADIAAVDLLAGRQAMLESDARTRRDRLKAAGGRGGLLSLQAWMELCRRQPFDGCSDGLVDALLPLAEAGHAMPRLQLAQAYLAGIDVARDEKAARGLVEAAARTWPRAGALVHFATMLDLHDAGRPAWLAEALDRAEQAGAGNARALRVSNAIEARATTLREGDEAWLARPEHNAAGEGFALLARLATYRKQADEAARWTARAADAGHAEALRVRAVDRLQAAPDDAVPMGWLRDAGNGGDGLAVRGLAYDAMSRGKPVLARDWLLGKVVEADVDAILMLAELYADAPEGIEQGPRDALEIYEQLHGELPEARRRLATMLVDGEGVAHDVARARALLEGAGDAESRLLLAGLLLSGRIPGDAAAGRRRFEAAVAAGDHAAGNDYGLWLANNGGDAAERRRGVDMLARAAEAQTEQALNNLAWIRCVSRHEDVRQPAAGLEAARRMGEPEALSPGHVDTVAACEAAAGRRDAAVRLQSLALSRLPAGGAYAATRKAMEARRALYARGGRYIESADED